MNATHVAGSISLMSVLFFGAACGLVAACASGSAQKPAASEPLSAEDKAELAEARSIAEACSKDESKVPFSGYGISVDLSSIKRASAPRTWSVDMAEVEPYRGRLPPPGPPRRHIYIVNTELHTCAPAEISQVTPQQQAQ